MLANKIYVSPNFTNVCRQPVSIYDAVCHAQLAWCCRRRWWWWWNIAVGNSWWMTFVAVGPAAILDICGTKPVQVAAVFGVINMILKEHLSQPTHNVDILLCWKPATSLITVHYIQSLYSPLYYTVHQSLWSVTLGSTLTPMFPQDPTLWRPHLPVLHFYASFGSSTAWYLGSSSSHWYRVWCYCSWTTAMQCWQVFHCTLHGASSSSRMRVINHNWSATKQRLHPQSVAEISCHSVLSGDRIRHLQSVMNVAARLVFTSSKCDHIMPLLRQLHWLEIPWRIDYKLAVLA